MKLKTIQCSFKIRVNLAFSFEIFIFARTVTELLSARNKLSRTAELSDKRITAETCWKRLQFWIYKCCKIIVLLSTLANFWNVYKHDTYLKSNGESILRKPSLDLQHWKLFSTVCGCFLTALTTQSQLRDIDNFATTASVWMCGSNYHDWYKHSCTYCLFYCRAPKVKWNQSDR